MPKPAFKPFVDPYEANLKADVKKSSKQISAETSKLQSGLAKGRKERAAAAPKSAAVKKPAKPMGLRSRRNLEARLATKGLDGL